MQTIPNKYNLDQEPKNYLELWKWFSDDSSKVKDKMWAHASFLYTLLGAVLAYIARLTEGAQGSLLKIDPIAILMASIIGIIISSYGIYMVYQYGIHLQTGWNRADYIKQRIEGLQQIWVWGAHNENAHENGLQGELGIPPVAKRLIFLMALFMLLFLALFLFTMFYLFV